MSDFGAINSPLRTTLNGLLRLSAVARIVPRRYDARWPAVGSLIASEYPEQTAFHLAVANRVIGPIRPDGAGLSKSSPCIWNRSP